MREGAKCSVMNHNTRRYKRDTSLVARSKNGTRIYKRGQNGGWNFKSKDNGRVRYFPLGIDKTDALVLADQIRAHLILYPFQEVWDKFNRKAFSKDKPKPPTLGRCLKTLADNQLALGITDITLRGYRQGLTGLIKKVIGKDPGDDWDLGQINEEFLSKFKKISLEGLKDEAAIASRKRSINSRLRQAKAVFSRPKLFKDYDMDFAEILKAEEFYKKLKKQYRLPSQSIISKTFDLFHNSEGDIYTLLGLSLHFGLRRNEAFHCRRDWFDLSEDRARINIVADREFRPKGGHEGFTMGSKAIAKAILNKASGEDLLISTRSDYGRVLYDDLIKQLRSIGWTRPNPLHELRKLFGSYVASTEGIYVSQKFLRHADASTTNDSYADVMPSDKIKNLWVA
jgi:integrase